MTYRKNRVRRNQPQKYQILSFLMRYQKVGSGPCILLSHLCSAYSVHRFTGIEPVGPGFELFREPLNILKANFGFNLHEDTYENFNPSKKYDLIFLINVFEHLPDWRGFLQFAKNILKPNGKCIILCPNYSFPYESHFGIPIIFGKDTTSKIFRKYISNFESSKSSFGLWASLNFVKLRQVIKETKAIGLDSKINTQINVDLINRLSCDPEFAERQRFIGSVAKILESIGLVKALGIYPFFLFQPYMHIEISIKPDQPQP
ncbi:MAG: methyltransferase domain-containing protein [Hydrogenophaga sp.]|nr:methyltransferase domain-containing protein [Hydrogenophaga sp.]MDP3322318.1 methyltransferase domain-containing protein [Hydrogenophaga sp.]